MSLIDAYLNGPYQIYDAEGHIISTDHHAVAVLSTNGIVFLCRLNISNVGTQQVSCLGTEFSQVAFTSMAELGWSFGHVAL